MYDGVICVLSPTVDKLVRVKVPVLTGDSPSNWAIPLSDTYDVPSVGDRVFVQFAGGDISKPIYSVTISSRPW